MGAAQSNEERARFLRDELAYHEHREHVLEHPILSPRKYWEMRRELAALEGVRGVARTQDSASLRAGAPPRASFTTRAHGLPWPSPALIRSPSELRRYFEAVAAKEGPSPVSIGAARLAGAELALTYTDGVLSRALLRGNGREGEDVTDNARTLGSIPLMLRPPGTITESRVTQLTKQALGPSTMTPVPPFPPELVVRGTVSARIADLVALDRRRVDAGEPPYVQAAAAVLSSLRKLNPRVTAHRRLSFFAHSVARAPDGTDSHWQLLGALKSWGFRVLPLAWRLVGIDEALDFVNALQQTRPSFDLPLDGGIITLSRLVEDAASSYPRVVQMSLSPSGRRGRVQNVYRAVGRGGAVLPVALLAKIKEDDPPIPEGAPIPAWTGQRVLAVEPGANVRVTSGSVAPQLLLDAADGKTATIALPTTCGACQQALTVPPDEPFGRCENAACSGKRRSRILHLIGPRGLLGGALSPRAAEALFAGASAPLTELFGVDPAAVERAQAGAGEPFRVERDKSKSLPMWRVLYLSGIPEVGERVARLVAAEFDGPGALLGRGQADLAEIPEIPPEAVAPLASWIVREGRAVFGRLAELGVTIVGDAESYAAPLSGKRIALAGKLEKLTLEQAIDEIERRGGVIEPRVTRRTEILVAGAAPGDAITTAESYGVMVVEELAFFGMLRLSA